MQKDTININGTSYRIYKDDQAIAYPINPVNEVIVRRIVGLNNNQTKIIDFADVNDSVKIESIYINSTTETTLNISVLKDNISLFDWAINKSNTPFQFPCLVLEKGLLLSLKASGNIARILIFAKPSQILFSKDF